MSNSKPSNKTTGDQRSLSPFKEENLKSRLSIFLVVALCAAFICSCSTTGGRGGSTSGSSSSSYVGGQYVLSGQNYSAVMPLDLSVNYLDPNTDLPLGAVIQPEDIMTSPVLDIATLREMENYDGIKAVSAIEAQASAKEEIAQQLEQGIDVDTKLHEEEYGLSSGSLSADATKSSLEYVSSKYDFSNSIAEYVYCDGLIYELITAPKAYTDFRLEPGEVLTSDIIISDPDNWFFSLGTSTESGNEVLHIVIRPRKVGLDSTMMVLTNYRTYYFRLGSFENYYMTGVRFSYPTNIKNVYEEYKENYASNAAFSIDASKADYEYSLEIVLPKKSQSIAWAPTSVYSTGTHTFIVFPTSILTSTVLPSLSVSSDGGKTEEIVFYRVNNNLWKIDFVLSSNQMFVLKTSTEQINIFHR